MVYLCPNFTKIHQ